MSEECTPETFDKLRQWVGAGWPNARSVEIGSPTKYAASAWYVTLIGKKRITVEECAFFSDANGDIGEGENPEKPGEYWFAAKNEPGGYPFVGLGACIEKALQKADELGA